jgi:hypothetical protein
MIKALAYATLAVVLGIAVILVPTWLLLVKVDPSSFGYAEKFSSGRIPLLSPENGIDEPIMPQWPGVVAAGLLAASIAFALVKRRGSYPRGQAALRSS